jgi:isoleucyl-tRNA synthetase
VRSVVTGALEIARANKTIGSSLEASPKVYVETFESISNEDFAEVCITSGIEVIHGEIPAGAFMLENEKRIGAVVEKAEGQKCARSWKISKDIGSDKDFPDITARDAAAVREWQTRFGKTV